MSLRFTWNSTLVHALALALAMSSLVSCRANKLQKLTAGEILDGGESIDPGVRLLSCALAPDQGATLTGRWEKLPVPIALQEGAFQPSEVQAIIKAADVWNEYFREAFGVAAFDYAASDGAVVTSPVPAGAGLCSTTIITDGKYHGRVLIQKRLSWGRQDGQFAYASYCTKPSTDPALRHLHQASIHLNFEHFFVAGKQQPDLQSVMTNQFGALLGLGPSCLPSPAHPGVPDCRSAAVQAEFNAAVMYPLYRFDRNGSGEIKREIQKNDRNRAACLYEF